MANLPGGIGLGSARGDITIGHNFNRVSAAARQFADEIDRSFGNVDRSTRTAETALNRMDSGARNAARGMGQVRDASQDLSRALGIVGGVAGLIQFGRFALDAERVATAYRRQRVAAIQLAGSQEQLNALLEAYERASGGAVDEATALANVTRLMAVGFGNSEEDIERFTTAVRGASIAMNVAQEQMSQEIQLAISNQSLRRLDQIGLGIGEVNSRIEELRANNDGMTREAAFQEAILGLLIEKFGGLAESAEGQKTGIEGVTRAWRNQRLALGQIFGGIANVIATPLASWLQRNADFANNTAMAFERLAAGARAYAQALNLIPRDLAPTLSSRTGIGAAVREAPRTFTGPARFTDEQRSVIVEWDRARADIERTANNARLDATEQYESQRTSAIRRYEQTIAREAEDFARQRARAETQFQKDIADVQEDGAKREAEITRNLGKREADIHEQLGKRQADIREQVNDRLLDIEENYQKARERATRDHRDNLMDAASRLDARAIFEEQRRFKRQQEDLLEARDDQVEQAQEGADEQLEQAREAADDQIQVARESAAEQLEVARRNTQDRLEEMRADFEDRKRIEDEDRVIRLTRMAQDHNDQLTEMARQHSQRIQQIGEHAQQERDKLDEEFLRHLDELDVYIDGFEERQKRITDIAIKNYDKLFEHITRSLRTPPPPSTGGGRFGLPEIPEFQHGGFVPRDMLALLHKGERVLSANQVQAGAASIQIEAGAFQFHGMTGDPADLQLAVEGAFANILQRMGGPA